MYSPRSPNKRTLEQIPWTTYFERELFLESTTLGATTIHHAYLTSPVGTGPLFVTHHGAGSSGLSFAVLTSEIRKRLPSAGILSLDARGHGSTTITPAPELLDLSLETLGADFVTVLDKTKTQMGWKEMPSLILIGHSLGGAVVTDVAKGGKLGNAVLGYAVLDVVEGSAIDALQSMQTYLSTRPVGFLSVESGIEWHIRSRTIRNSVSARTSVPSLLVHNEKARSSRPWTWGTDLAATQPFWEGWFVGLSKKFLEARGGKLLLLAGTDRLDKELTIGQMQGELYQLAFMSPTYIDQENMRYKCFRKRAISSMKTCPKRLQMSSSTFTSGTTEVLLSYHRKSQSFCDLGRRYDRAVAIKKHLKRIMARLFDVGSSRSKRMCSCQHQRLIASEIIRMR